MDADSPNFDAKRYVLNMIKQNTIKQLITKNNQIDEEIKVHDHQIQSLVFENYSKFISSIDTVREMKENICKVDDKLKVLESSMDKIEELALKIDSTFSVKRKEIQKLDTINKDLEKLKNLCDFPNILKQDIAYYKSLVQNNIPAEAEKLFNKSVSAYESCYKTLIQLKDEPLIAPIYKESQDKVENIRSILKNLQGKGKTHNNILKSTTKKLLIITNDQVSILRIYFHSWKERLGQTCFKGPRKITADLSSSQSNRYIMNEVLNAGIPEINQQFWKQFVQEFKFIYKDVYSKLSISPEQIQLHVSNHMKDIFLWGLNNYVDTAPTYCASLKTYVHVNHIITNKIIEALDFVKVVSAKDEKKVYTELRDKMEQRLEGLGITMFNYIFGRLKIYFVLQIIKQKQECQSIVINEETIKQSQTKILNPLKDTLFGNFKIIIDELEHFRNIYELVFRSQSRYEQVIHKKIEELINFVSQIISLPSTFLSESIYTLINPNFNNKLNKIQKGIIENVLKNLRQSNESGIWFLVVHQFLTSLNNVMGKKIIENTQKNVEIPKNHDYGKVFTSSKLCISKNLLSCANYFANLITYSSNFQSMIEHIQHFMVLLNIIFSQNKRNVIKKPSFLTQQNSFAQQTQILTAKKLHLIEKKNPQERSSILTYFVRKIVKQILINLRKKRKIEYSENDIYNLIQICYELSNVEEESQVCAFFHLMKANWTSSWNQSRELMQEKYLEVRKSFVF